MAALNPQVIGKDMPHGFAGSYARQPDMIVNTRPVGGSDAITFGTALQYENGAVVPFSSTADKFAGVAGREIKSALTYLDQNSGAYAPGDACSVFQRGSINVLCQKGTAALGGKVYVRTKADASDNTLIVGGFEATADSGNNVELTNCQWGGASDANKVAELVILTRVNA